MKVRLPFLLCATILLFSGGAEVASNARGTLDGAQAQSSSRPPNGYQPQASTSITARSAAAPVTAIDVLLIEDLLPWGSTANEDLLSSSSIPFKKIQMGELASENLRDYKKVVIAGDQDSAFYSTYATNRSVFDSFVTNGGQLEWHLAGFGWNGGDSGQVVLPGGLGSNGFAHYLGNNYVTSPSHPLALGLSSPFSGTYASHGYFGNQQSMPGLEAITTQGPTEGDWPTLISYPYGKGCVVASTQPLEYGFQRGQATGTILSNMIPFSCAESGRDPKPTGTGYVVTVDGMNLRSIINPGIPPEYSHYLYDAFECDPKSTNDDWCERIQGRVGQIIPFEWSRNVYDTDQTVYELSAVLEGFTKLSKKNHGPLVVVAHSWGTVLAYIAISRNPNIVIDRLVTLGSPLQAQDQTAAQFTRDTLSNWGLQKLTAPSNVKAWDNYWEQCDPISGSIAAAKKLNFTFGTQWSDQWGTCHGSYFSDFNTWLDILLVVYLTK
jgi:hypothetical protein